MSFLSTGFGIGNPFFRPDTTPLETMEFQVNKNNIYSMLTRDFSIFKTIIDKSVYYRDLLNENTLQLTLLIPPDSILPENVKQNLLKLDRAECTTLLSYHTIEKSPKLVDGHIYKTRHLGILLSRIGNQIYLPQGESRQIISLLSEGNYFGNGIVYVIDQPIIEGVE